MVKQARVHDSALGPFQNQQMIEISQAYDLKMEDDIAAIMRGEDAPTRAARQTKTTEAHGRTQWCTM